jgi:cell division protein FtsN
MEARTAFRGPAVSRNVVAIVAAVLVAFALGAFGGYLVKAWSLPVAAPSAQIAVHRASAVGPATREPAGYAMGTHGPTQGAQHAGH